MQVILRDDTALVNKRGGFRVYVGNLAPSVGWQMLHEHFTRGFHEHDAVELRSKVPVDAAGQPLGFGLVEPEKLAAHFAIPIAQQIQFWRLIQPT